MDTHVSPPTGTPGATVPASASAKKSWPRLTKTVLVVAAFLLLLTAFIFPKYSGTGGFSSIKPGLCFGVEFWEERCAQTADGKALPKWGLKFFNQIVREEIPQELRADFMTVQKYYAYAPDCGETHICYGVPWSKK